jgi:Phosphate transport regulator (distant homolog of PhoU)
MKRWFLAQNPDVLGLLNDQVMVTLRGLDSFVDWSAGNVAAERAVRDAEHEADNARRRLMTEVLAAFSPPLEPEDIYELSERLDAVLNGAKNVVREAEVMAMAPDPPLAEMAGSLRDGVGHIGEAFRALVSDADRATTEADAAIKCVRALEHSYRLAMSKLLAERDVGEITGRRELYRRYARLGEGLESVAERVWYSVVKKR